MGKNVCSHVRKAFFRQQMADGRFQVREACLDCWENPRGSGVWVSRSELIVPLEDLPLYPDAQERVIPGQPRQGDLFGG
jgi:hypothetical protein